MANERILVTGANGLLGQHLVPLLVAPEREVVGWGRQERPRFEAALASYERVDLADRAGLRAALDAAAPDTIVHCAAMTRVDDCERNPAGCRKINLEAVEEVVAGAARHSSRLVHLSTDFVFDGRKERYTEDDSPAPLNEYGRAKLAAEEAVRDGGIASWAIVRTVLVYTARPIEGRPNIASWIIDSLRSGTAVDVVDDQWRTPTFVEDLAGGISRLLERRQTGVYHIAGGELLSVHAFALRVAEVLGLPSELIRRVDGSSFRQPARRPPRTGFAIEKAQRELGYEPTPIDVALRRSSDPEAPPEAAQTDPFPPPA